MLIDCETGKVGRIMRGLYKLAKELGITQKRLQHILQFSNIIDMCDRLWILKDLTSTYMPYPLVDEKLNKLFN
jgi:hypothetical protein